MEGNFLPVDELDYDLYADPVTEGRAFDDRISNRMMEGRPSGVAQQDARYERDVEPPGQHLQGASLSDYDLYSEPAWVGRASDDGTSNRMMDGRPSGFPVAQQRARYERNAEPPGLHLQEASPSAFSPGTSSAALTPGSATDWSEVSRKRRREPSVSDNEQQLVYGNSGPASPSTPMSFSGLPGAWPETKRSRSNAPHQAVDFIDLTEDPPMPQPFLQPPPSTMAGANVYHFPDDPFPELFHTRQPTQMQNQQRDVSAQQLMNLDEFAEFMIDQAAPSYDNTPYYWGPIPNNDIPQMVPPSYPGVTLGNRPLLSPAPDERGVVDSIIENIKRQDDDGLPREQTPKQMSCSLMEHQKQALAWLLGMEKGSNKGSILADEMGLGKTIEGLSLIIANPSKNAARKTTLIVAPVALMRQWEKEIERHIKPAHRLRVYVYHRGGKKADWNVLRDYDIVLTTFGTLAQEQKRLDNSQESAAIDRERQDPGFKRTSKEKLGLLDPNCYWYRVILDEAQCIKNRGTLTSKAAAALKAEYRLCMTGTPMQNSVEELYPLVRFLHITAYQSWQRFNDDIAKPVKSGHNMSRERGMTRLQALIKSITLRREKTSIVDGRPVVDLPPKYVNICPVRFSSAEMDLYKAVETKSQIRFNHYLQKGQVSKNYANILVMLLRLRQICCHPHLVSDLGVQVSTDGIKEEELKERAKMLDQDVVRRLKNIDGDGFECPICYETELNPTIIIPCGHHCCGECFQKLIDPARGIRDGNENSAPKCPNCRGALSVERITDFRHFCKVFCPEKYTEMRRGFTDGNVSEDEETADDSDSDSHSDSDSSDANDSTLGGFIVDDDVNDDVESSEPNTPTASHHSKKAKGKAKAKPKHKSHLSLAELKKRSMTSDKARAAYLRRLQKDFKSSAKIDETMRLLEDIRANDPSEKTLIFSSFTTLLDLLEVPLRARRYKYQRYDGSMKFDDRVDAVNEFMDKSDENIMLVSIKAGNAGLNLNKASRVIMMDPFWNPFVEDQAVDRAHRMPQKRDVHVHRVLVPETVEDRICKLQDKKREVISAALDERVGKSLTKLSVGELRSLFGM